MDWLKALRARLRTVFRRSDVDRDLSDEVLFHLEMQTEQFIAGGLTPDEARRQARLLFGSVDVQHEAVRDMRALRSIEGIYADVRYAVRSLGRAPAFTLVAILTVALGIGANAGLFGLVNSLFLRTPPGVSETAPLVRVARTVSPRGVSYASYQRIAAEATSFDAIAAYMPLPLDLALADEASRIQAGAVSVNYFDVLGVRPALGRHFVTDDRDAAVAVLTHSLWKQRFGSDARVVGRTVVLNGKPFTIIGVAPEVFTGTEFEEPAQAWIPIAALPIVLTNGAELLRNTEYNAFALTGRLRDGTRPAAAEAELAPIARRIEASSPVRSEPWYDGFELRVDRLRGWYPLDVAANGAVGFAWVVTTLVLLVVCANLMNLLLSRAVGRQREISVRLALGISRNHLVRLLLTEAMVIAVVGGALGVLASIWAAHALQSALMNDVGGMLGQLEVSPDASTFVYSFILVVITGLVFGLVPALRASRPGLDARGGATGWRSRSRLQGGLVIVQIAVSLVLLLSGGLFLRRLQEMRAADQGFDTAQVLTLSVDLSNRRMTGDERLAFFEELRTRSTRIAGVEHATAPSAVPLGRITFMVTDYVPLESTDAGPPIILGEGRPAGMRQASVGAGFFSTLGIPIVRGRAIDEIDVSSQRPVAVVSESFAEMYWPGEEAVGRELVRRADRNERVTVVGVSGDISSAQAGGPIEPHIYLPVREPDLFTQNLMVRTSRDPALVAAELRREIRRMDSSLSPYDVRTIGEVVDQQVGFHRVITNALTALGAVAMLLAAVGLYGVIALAVRGRVREVGIRMALGAQSRDVVLVFLRDGLKLVAAGVFSGAILAGAAGALISSLVLGTKSFDLLALTAAATLMFVVAAVSTLLPALAAARVDPLVTLKTD